MAVQSATDAQFGVIEGRAPASGSPGRSLGHSVATQWNRALRRLAHGKGVLERRRFRPLRRTFYDDLWKDAAAAVGARLSVLPNGLVRIARGDLATFVDGSDLMIDSAIMTRVLANKALTYELMAAKNLPLPPHRVYGLDCLDRAEAFMRSAAGPVVVKPADGTGGGHGVTTGITTIAGLRTASRHAASFHRQLLVERQLEGASFRLLYLDGAFIDAVRRDSPVLVGDGRSTLRKLIDDENRRRRECRPIVALSPLTVDAECRNTLAAAGMRLDTVPGHGEAVRIKLAVNENEAAQNHVVRSQVHREIVEAGARLVRELGIGFAGLDVTSLDIAAPIAAGGTIFNEINAGPGIHHHYLVSNSAERADVATLILERIFATGLGTVRI